MLRLTSRSSAHIMLGIDFGSYRIKAVAIKHTGGLPQIKAMASVATPAGAIVDHQLQNIPQVVQALTQLKRLLGVGKAHAATAVTGSSVTTKILQVPSSLTVDMLALHMRQEAARHLSFPLDEISLDFEMLEQDSSHTNSNQVLLSAARTDHVQARVQALKQVGWRTQVVDIGSHALARAVVFLLSPTPTQVVATLDIGAASLTLIVIAQGDIIYQRLQPLASESFNANGPHNVEQITRHVQQNIQLYCSNSEHPLPERLMLCGGFRPLTDLAHRLHQALAIEVIEPDFRRVFGDQLPDYSDAGAFSTALGLALRKEGSCLI